MKKSACLLLVLFLVCQSFALMLFPAEASTQSGKLTVHYNRPDGNYEGWNLWVWEINKDGKSYAFTGKDDYGVFAEVEIAQGQTGFIVRLNEWEAKDVDTDRFVTVGGATEIWLKSGDPKIYSDAAGTEYVDKKDQASGENLEAGTPAKAKVVYYRFDQNYEGWNLWVWPRNGDGVSYPFTGETELSSLPGKKAVTAEVDVSGFSTEDAGIIVRKGEWEAKDVEKDRFFPLTKTGPDGTITLYLVQGIEPITYSEEDAKHYLQPGFASAEFTDPSTIKVTLQAPAQALGGNEGFKLLENGAEVGISKIIRGSDGLGFVLKLNKEANLSMTYVLSKQDFGETGLSTSRLFDTESFNTQFYYEGNDLGATYSKTATKFRLWAPTAEKVVLKLYSEGRGGQPSGSIDMAPAEKGTWTAQVDGDLNGTYYTYEVTVNGKTNEAVDPYAKAVGVNGDRGMVVDLSATNPGGWDKVNYVKLTDPTDAVIYEMHVRDTSIDPSSGVQNKGKYLGLAEKNTKSPTTGVLTGLAHVKELGATHIHLLPVYDYNSVDESRLDTPQFNWGYDPKNYNAPEGSYSTDPLNGATRVKEFKEMVKSIKDEGIGVIMDVVYNHTALSSDSDFNLIVPGYYYRMTGDKFSNGSGCGNEVASQRVMVRKFIIDSVVYWAKEYKVDGFRFDLMGLIDTETMNEVTKALKAVDPSIIIYGEGWTAGATTLPQNQQTIKANISKVPDAAVFNDSARDGIKGDVFNAEKPGFVSGDFGLKESVMFGIVGAISHPGVNYNLVNYDKVPYALSPAQCVNYIAAHDNLTLYDKFTASAPGKTEADFKAMTRLGGAIQLTSQGIPFMLSGTDFMRSKGGNSNSYNAPDSVNAINWDLKNQNIDVFNYYKGLISLRKAHPAFRMATSKEVVDNLKFIDGTKESVIAYTIGNNANKDNWKTIFVAFNAGTQEETVALPLDTTWNVVVNGEKAGVDTLAQVQGASIKIPAMSSIVAYDSATATQPQPAAAAATEPAATAASAAGGSGAANSIGLILAIAAGALILLAAGFFFLKSRKK